jgi:hypothetical protein
MSWPSGNPSQAPTLAPTPSSTGGQTNACGNQCTTIFATNTAVRDTVAARRLSNISTWCFSPSVKHFSYLSTGSRNADWNENWNENGNRCQGVLHYSMSRDTRPIR